MNDMIMTAPHRLADSPVDLKQPARVLNLGCGARFHPACVNVDLHPHHPSVVRHDVRQPLPFASGSFDAVFHSHLLEHLPTERVFAFLTDCWRVLRPGGILRVAVPDLEQIARLYLQALDKSLGGDGVWQERYEWLMLELFDQVGRERPGGAMLDYFRQVRPLAQRFAMDRLGADSEPIRRFMRTSSAASPAGWSERMRSWFSPRRWRERILRWLLGNEYAALECGRFRAAGEVHRTMYDRYSLGRLLTQAGFAHIRMAEPGDSAIPGWSEFHLERDAAGNVLKPDSLFMEAIKPG
jgi:predicted SAM-dependent methyltransferase